MVSSSSVTQVNKLAPARTFLMTSKKFGEKRGIFRLGNNEPGTTRTSEFNLNGRHVDVVGSANNKDKTYLGQPTIGLRCYGWETSTEGSLRRKTGEKEEKEKEKESRRISAGNPASLGSLASNEYVLTQIMNLTQVVNIHYLG